MSQLGAVEIGLSVLDKQPAIEPYLYQLVKQIKDDDPDEANSRWNLLSSLIVLFEGELSKTRILIDEPPFWRRLASIAQASLVERSIIGSQVDITHFINYALKARGQLFCLQTMTDLRTEPRWHPDYASSLQLQQEVVGRIFNSAQLNSSKIQTSEFRDLLFGEGAGSVQSVIKFPFVHFPGPLEGGLESQNDPPDDLVKEIERQLCVDILHPDSFAALVNSVLIFRLDSEQVKLAAKSIRLAQYQLKQVKNIEQLLSVITGLATVAAVTRNSELALELRVLVRRLRYEHGHNLSAIDIMWVGLNAAAAYSDLKDWCIFLGEWLTELAFNSLDNDEMNALHSHISQLCHIVPELWTTCGRAEAALTALINSRPDASV